MSSNPITITQEEFKNIITGRLKGDPQYSKFYLTNDINQEYILFKNCLVSDRRRILIENETITNYIIFGENTVFDAETSFQNCTFQDALYFEGVTFNKSLFLKCKFQGILIDNITCKESITWNSSVFNKHFILSNGIFKSSFNITECSFKKLFHIENGIFDGSVTLSGFFESNVRFAGGEYNSNFKIGQKDIASASEFKTKVSISGGKYKDFFIIQNVNFHQNFSLLDKKVEINKFQIIKANFEEHFVIAHAKINTVTIFGGNYKKELNTHFAEIKEFYITGGSFENINIKEGDLRKLTIKHKDEIDNLSLSSDSLIIKEITFQQSTIINALINGEQLNKISFDSTSLYKDSVIQVNNFRLKEISFLYFINLGYISFNNIAFDSHGKDKPNFKLSIINSDLGKTQFIDCKSSFPNYEVLEFANSKILDVFVSNTELPKNIEFPQNKKAHSFQILDNRIKKDKQVELAFNQLKKVYEARGDTSNALEYHAKALEARKKILFEELFTQFGEDLYISCIPKIFNPLLNILFFIIGIFLLPLISIQDKKTRRNFAEWINLLVNQFSNNYGFSWHRGVLTTFLVIILCYSFYCFLSGFTLGNWNNKIHQEQLLRLISYSGDFLNPIQKDDVFNKFYHSDCKKDFPLARIWGFVSRVIIAFFVYQTIQAFRKFGKKGN